jgi:hypothetical protein
MMTNVLYRKYFRVLSQIIFLVLTSTLALASPGGITGRTLKSTPNGCGSCHGSTASTSVVAAISGPITLNVGQTAQYTVTVNDTAGTSPGGVNIAASSGTLAVVSSNLRLANGELTHTGPQTIPATYTFNYTAPPTAGTVTLYATAKGNSMQSWNWTPNLSITVNAAGNPPIVTTIAASGISQTEATLNGSVNPNGLATNYYFQYGLTTSYGSHTTSTSAGSGSAAVNVNAAVTGLTAGTTYHFRLVATSAAGTTNGADLTFNTSGAQGPPAATTEPATSISSTGAMLHGTVNPNGLVTNYYFEYGTTTGYGAATTAGNAGSGSGDVMVSTNIGSLTASTLYHFRLVATSSAGTTYGADLIFTTSGAANAPVVITNPASNLTDTSAWLNGSVNPNGQSTTYYFEYGLSAAYGSTTGLGLAGSGNAAVTVSTSISELTPGNVYHFRLVAYNDGGTTNGDDQTFVTGNSNGIPGDMNGNGTANVVDLVILANILAGNINIAENPNLQPLNGDLNGSGSLDATDYVLLSMMIAND